MGAQMSTLDADVDSCVIAIADWFCDPALSEYLHERTVQISNRPSAPGAVASVLPPARLSAAPALTSSAHSFQPSSAAGASQGLLSAPPHSLIAGVSDGSRPLFPKSVGDCMDMLRKVQAVRRSA